MTLRFWKKNKQKPPAWSVNPGCYERHLQLRYGNPIFPERFRSVTEQELAHALAKDHQEAEDFSGLYVGLLKEVSACDDVILYEKVSALRERVDELLDKAAQIGGSVAEALSKLKELRELVTDTTYETFAGGDLKDGYDALQKAEQFNRDGRQVFRNPFIAQIHRIPDEELVPRLLSEDVETIRTTMKAMDEKAIRALQASSIQRVKEIIQEINDQNNPLFDELFLKLEVMGIKFNQSDEKT
jgi:hypothetical protein